MILYEAAGAQATAATQLNAAHGGKGWSCFGGPDLPVDLNATGAIDRLGQPPWIAAWVPGHTSNALPAGTGVLLHKGAKVVMQVHYNLIAGTGPDRSRAQLRLRPASTKLTALETHLVAARSSCRARADRPGRSAAARRRSRTRSPSTACRTRYIPTALLRLCGKTLADYPQDVGAGTRIPTSCDRPFTSAQTIYGVAGHMHLRGQDISVVLDPGTATRADAPAHPGVGLPLAGRLLPEDADQGRSRRHGAGPLHVRQLEGRAAGRRLGAAGAALRPLGRGHDRRDVPGDALGRTGA